MAVARSNVLRQVSPDEQLNLERLADEVNRSYFGNSINIRPRWGIPSACESPEPKTEINHLSPQELKDLQAGVEAYHKKDLQQAKTLLEQFSPNGPRDAALLYVRVLTLLKDPTWPDVAKSVNRVCDDTIYVAPGSIEMVSGEESLLVHPILSRSAGNGAPIFVIRYIIHHEMVHKFLSTSSTDPHPEAFRRLDACARDRSRALQWLRKNHFTTIEDSSR
ncbi:hypothetical protein [Pseudomonas aeruginosa]|uniref:hypothetical protein n=1 Tax=Pseudomonas aeruginosa TaxID=287 RepID=UPI000B31C934|nr:hypothetical protein [Pseudomonas aeruginosa]